MAEDKKDDKAPKRRRSDRRSYPAQPYDGPERRQSVIDRRLYLDEVEQRVEGKQEEKKAKKPKEESKATGLEQNRGPGKRLEAHTRSADKGEMTDEQLLFLKAIEAFKRVNQKAFPSWTDVLEVVRKLGYRKTQESELILRNVMDWTEAADAPSFPKAGEEEASEEAEQE